MDRDLKIFADCIEDAALRQIDDICSSDSLKGCKVRVMPDVHAGTGCVCGLTSEIHDKIAPCLIGVDIGCGMYSVPMYSGKELGADEFKILDDAVRNSVPSGMHFHDKPQTSYKQSDPSLKDDVLKMLDFMGMKDKIDFVFKEIGTLGGGNHFIEVDKSKDDGKYWLIIHTGSRALGKIVCEYWENVAKHRDMPICLSKDEKKKIIRAYADKMVKEDKKDKISIGIEAIIKSWEIQESLAEAEQCSEHYPYLEGDDAEMYLKHMKICQRYAVQNRLQIFNEIISCHDVLKIFKPYQYEAFTTMHNYIDFKGAMPILRKSAISACKDEVSVIPLSMGSGTFLCVGLGNEDWNCSAPHGAGRKMSRTQAKKIISMDEYKASMENVWSSSVVATTIDEAPAAYKDPISIYKQIDGKCVKVIEWLKPVYNFKASD